MRGRATVSRLKGLLRRFLEIGDHVDQLIPLLYAGEDLLRSGHVCLGIAEIGGQRRVVPFDGELAHDLGIAVARPGARPAAHDAIEIWSRGGRATPLERVAGLALGGEHALALAHILCRRCRHRHTDNHHTRDADPGFHLVASLR